MSLLDTLLALIAPHQCISCAFEGSLQCTSCSTRLPNIPPRCYRCGSLSDDFRTCRPCRRQSPLFGVRGVTVYDGAAKELIRRLKFERAHSAADIMARHMAQHMPAGADFLVTHAPTAPSRIRKRGYDQAELIARGVARRLGYRHASLLARQGRHRQVGQTRNTRRKQMAEAFRPLKQEKLLGKHILIVDDVLTTGSTLEAAAAVLKDAGAKRVSAVVFAVA